MHDTGSINHAEHGRELLAAFEGIEQLIGKRGIERRLHHLILLRISQINRCAYCVHMHARDARAEGETNERLDHLIVWRHRDDYSAREKAALAWAEALTVLSVDTDLGRLRAELRAHFTDNDITTLTSIVAMINLWNRIQISNH